MSNIIVSGPQDTLLAQANIKKVFMNVDNRFVQVPIGTALAGATNEALANKADLVNGKLDPAQLPDLAIAQYLGEVANQAAMLALVGQSGDWCSRTDTGLVYVVTGNTSVVSGWTQLKYPASAVQSVCGLAGAITLAQLTTVLGLGQMASMSLAEVKQALSGDIVGETISRNLSALDDGDRLHCADGITLTIPPGLGSKFGCAIYGNVTIALGAGVPPIDDRRVSGVSKPVFAIEPTLTSDAYLLIGSKA